MAPVTENDLLADDNDIVQQPGARGDAQLTAVPLKTPFQKIALALSGGGFRAAAYSLGAMSYLHHLKYPDGAGDKRVLDNVTFISSASGGTFAGILYSMHVKQGKPFGETYTALLRFMQSETLLEQALQLINDDRQWTEGKSRNLINAFARVYSSNLFGDQTFGVYWPEANKVPERPLEVCFNTTEFYRGLSFRFQGGNSIDGAGKTGNEFLFFKTGDPAHLNTLKSIRLGDIMAASSCFPAGFEPILFPNDFAYKDNSQTLPATALHQALTIKDYNNRPIDYQPNIGFMDGGVDDNQGVYSLMTADKRRRKANPENGFDLIFVTDVASYFMKPYVEPAKSKGPDASGTLYQVAKRYHHRIRLFRGIVNGLVIGSLLLLILGFVLYYGLPAFQYHDAFLVTVGVLATLLAVGIAAKWLVTDQPLIKKLQNYLGLSDAGTVALLQQEVPVLKEFSESTLNLLAHYLKNSPLGVLGQMLQARLNSLLSMVLDVNLKQTRRLIFDIFYGNFYGSDTWGNRRVFNVIYELSTKNRSSRLHTLEEKLKRKEYQLPEGTPPDNWKKDCLALLTKGCEKLEPVAEKASAMGTTLWVDREDADTKRVMAVLVCGQFTTCAKLLEHTLTVDRLLQIQNLQPSAPKAIDFDAEQLRIFKDVKQQLEEDWEAFKQNPYFLKESMDTDSGT